jgi:hypothetical protein
MNYTVIILSIMRDMNIFHKRDIYYILNIYWTNLSNRFYQKTQNSTKKIYCSIKGEKILINKLDIYKVAYGL